MSNTRYQNALQQIEEKLQANPDLCMTTLVRNIGISFSLCEEDRDSIYWEILERRK